MRKIIFLLVVILIMGNSALAYNLDNITVDLQNGAYIHLPYNQTYDGTHNDSYGYFQFDLNSSNLTFSSNTNRTLLNIVLSSSTDTYSFNSNGSVGWFNISATMQNASNNYSFYINDTYVESRNTSTLNQVYFNYTVPDVNLKTYKINWTINSVSDSVITAPSISNIVENISHNWVNISFDVNQSNANTTVCYGLTGGYELGCTDIQISGLSRYGNLTSLTNNKLYYYSISAANASDFEVAENAPGTFTTLANPGEIISYSPIDLNYVVDINTLIVFNATANQSVNWTWSGVNELSGDGTNNSNASQTWLTTGLKTVNLACSNINGSCVNLTWNVTVVNDGSGGGTNYDWAYGWVKDINGNPVEGVTVNTTEGSNVTDSNGYYSFTGYNFIHNGVYLFNATKANYNYSSQNVTFSSGDYEIVNFTMNVTNPVLIVSYAPGTPNSTQVNSLATFNISINQVANVTWYIDNVLQQTNLSVTSAIFTNVSYLVTTKTVKVYANNSNGSASQIWSWVINPYPSGIIESWSNNFTNDDVLSFEVNVSDLVLFNVTSNQTMDSWTWYGATLNSSNDRNSSAIRTFTTSGIKTIYSRGTNQNGTTNTKTWLVTVLGDSGTGSTEESIIYGIIFGILGSLIFAKRNKNKLNQ